MTLYFCQSLPVFTLLQFSKKVSFPWRLMRPLGPPVLVTAGLCIQHSTRAVHLSVICLVIFSLASSFQMKEVRSSPKRRQDGRLSRTPSTEREPAGEPEAKKQSDENKENRRLDEYLSDQDSWNESVISGMSPHHRRGFALISLWMYKSQLAHDMPSLDGEAA